MGNLFSNGAGADGAAGWTANDFAQFAQQNLVRSNRRNYKTLRMLNGGLPYPDLIGFSENRPYCFVTGIRSGLCVPIHCTPRGLELIESAMESQSAAAGAASANSEEQDAFDVMTDAKVPSVSPSPSTAQNAPDANDEADSASTRADRLEKHAAIRDAASIRKTRASLCTELRKLRHSLEHVSHNACSLTVNAIQATVVEACNSLSDLVAGATASASIPQIQLSFYDVNERKMIHDGNTQANHIEQLIVGLTQCIDVLADDDLDGSFTVYPARRTKQLSSQEAKLRQDLLDNRLTRRAPHLRVLPFMLSTNSIKLAVKGDAKLGVAPLAKRGFGDAAERDFTDDYRVMQIRDMKGGLYFVTDFLPLMAFFPNREVCLQVFRQSLSRIMYHSSDRFHAELIEMIVPKVLASLVKMLMKSGGDVDWARYEIWPMLYYTALEAVADADAASHGSVLRRMYANVMKFSFSRARHGNTIGNLAEFLCKAAITGVPFTHFRDAFVREFLIRAIRGSNMRTNATEYDFKVHIEQTRLQDIRTFLMLLTFDGGQQALSAKLNMFRSNGGSLSQEKKHIVRMSIAEILKIRTLEQAFLAMGLAPVDMPEYAVKKLVLRSVRWAMNRRDTPYDVAPDDGHDGAELAEPAYLLQPKLGAGAQAPVMSLPLTSFFRTRGQALTGQKKLLEKTHKDVLPSAGEYSDHKLPATMCAVCNVNFPTREQLFRCHLDKVFGDLSSRTHPLNSRHSSHYALRHEPYDTVVSESGNKIYQCNAMRCDAKFYSLPELHRHFHVLGVPGDWDLRNEASALGSVAGDVKGQPADADIDFDLDECDICMDGKITTMFLPCGHQSICDKCATNFRPNHSNCHLCRTPISVIVRVQTM
jgi:Zinc finger, C3HC4 type (RING finger)